MSKKIFISDGNEKIGNIMNISLTPGLSCKSGVACLSNCYAIKIIKRFAHVKYRWKQNLIAYLDDGEHYFIEISNAITKEKPTHFRWHIGGDIPDKDYLNGMIFIANMHKEVRFMCYTKRYDFVKDLYLPENLTIILSMWPYLKEPVSDLKKAWVRGDFRTPVDAYECIGTCTECLFCWKPAKDIVLKPH